jgi:hypothetical protein
MKLSMGVIIDSLSIKPEYVCGDSNHALVLSDIRVLPAESKIYDKEILYFERWEHIEKHIQKYPEYLICIGGGTSAERLFKDENIRGMIFPHEDFNYLFSYIQSIFLKYNQLEYNLMEALIQSKPTRDILNICSEFFQNHVMLFDSMLNIIEYSSSYLPDENDLEWKETFETSRVSLRVFNEIRRLNLTNSPATSFASEYVKLRPDFPNRISCAIYHVSRRIGTLSVTESNKPLSAYQAKVLDHISSVVSSTIIRRYASLFDSMQALRSMFIGMLSGVEPDQHNVARTLKLVNWNIKDKYCLVIISIPEIRNDISKIFYYLYEYENTFPDCVGFIFLDNILLLLHNDTEAMMAKCTPKLEKLLMTHDAVCGISVPFCSITQINAQYINARLAIQIGTKDERIRVLKDYLDEHLVRLVAGATSIIPLCHRGVIQIMEYDKENGTEFLTSLEVYLRQNRSLKSAATELFIHRNTLSYRLRCIENIVTMNLENSHERLHVLLSCIVLRIMGAT